ncbi:MAG: hypothetical protein ACHBN1_14370 [Heteroscytonema crispum UTEX LB 1556]
MLNLAGLTQNITTVAIIHELSKAELAQLASKLRKSYLGEDIEKTAFYESIIVNLY